MKKIVQVRFEDNGTLCGKAYSYFTYIEDLKVDEWVIVVVDDIPKTVVVVKTSGISTYDRQKASKWIAGRVDLSDYYAKMEQRKVAAELEVALGEELKAYQRFEMALALADKSPRIKQLLQKLGTLDSDVKNLIGN